MESLVAGPGRQTNLRGRASERAALDALLRDVRAGQSRSLIVRGEAGIGKTALLEYLISSASDLTVVRTAGVESDMELAYASLHQLCVPLLDRLDRLPAPQRQALEIVFSLSAGPAPDRFLVGLAVLSFFSEVTAERPLLCVIDDAQWLDQVSALTLAFVSHRLLAERVGLVFAAREPGQELQHLPELEVHGLVNADARTLLSSAVRFKLDERIRDRIIAETRGNPLALLELPRGLTATQLAGGFGLPEAQALTGRIEESFVRRLEPLAEDARRLLLLAAADPVGDPLLLWRAADQLGIGPAAVDSAAAQGLVVIEQRVTFRHPLVRSAVYRTAAVQERRAAHLALAEATDREIDPDRRAWHLAAAAARPDEQVALELERSAGRAQARGGLAAAAAFLQRAVALTQDPARRADRALAGAQAGLQAGAFDLAHELVARAEAGALDEFQRARVDMLHAQIAFTSNRGSDAPPLLLGAAKRLEPLDATLARETYLEALMAAMFAGRFATGAALEVAEAMCGAPPSPSPRGPDLLLDGFAVMITEGHRTGAPLLKRAVHAFRNDDVVANGGFRWLFLAEMAAIEVWDYDAWRELTVREMQLVRDAGALTVLATALSVFIYVHIFAGELAVAASLIDEQRMITEASGSRLAPHAALILAAWRGRETDLQDLVEETIREVVPRGEGIGLSATQWVRALLHNGHGHYESALAAAQQLMEPPRRFDQAIGWALPELIEAAVRTGQSDIARDGVAQLSDMTRPGGTDWGLGLEARCRALLSEHEEAEHLYRDAIERLGRTRIRGEHARAHLLYGEWLRRENRRVDAREQLRQAHAMFTEMGMEAFAERARGELLATGERVRKPTLATREELTAQERKIGQLAGDGLSNPEIGARLFLSPRTVEWHLRNVFTKLGVGSRRELADALPSSHSQLVNA
jgi:DNA-binding CsgD family transcriptional regulator/tetratricopeptide (TPR) repeat protein